MRQSGEFSIDRRGVIKALVATGAVVSGLGRVARAEGNLDPFASDLSPHLASSCVRARVNTRVAESGANVAMTFRSLHKTNVGVHSVQLEYWNGYVLNTGIKGYMDQSPERSAAGSVMRGAVLQGLSGNQLDQSAAKLFPVTWLGMRDVPGFVAAGGQVSDDGVTITVPPGAVIRCDPLVNLRLKAGERYMVQMEDVREEGAERPMTYRTRPDLGDATSFRREPSDSFAHGDWSDAFSGPGMVYAPSFIWGLSDEQTAVVMVDGDSIVSENLDLGDEDGALGFGKRALNRLGLSYFDLSVPGTNMSYVLDFDAFAVRRRWVPLADFIITNHGNNDLGVSSFEPSPGKRGFLAILEQHTAYLRSIGKPGVPVMRTTLNPRTKSADEWMTLENQSTPNVDDTYPEGARYQWRDYVLRRGAFEGRGPTTAVGDLIFDYAAALGSQEGRWPVNGTAKWATLDGTHPSQVAHEWVGVLFAEALEAHFGGQTHPLIVVP